MAEVMIFWPPQNSIQIQLVSTTLRVHCEALSNIYGYGLPCFLWLQQILNKSLQDKTLIHQDKLKELPSMQRCPKMNITFLDS
jgi:hypothetical protein